MVATFLGTATDDGDDLGFADYGRLPVAEVTSVLGLAVRLRLGGMPTQRSQEWGGAARYVALAGTLLNATLGVWSALPLLIWFLVRDWAPRPDPANPDGTFYFAPFGPGPMDLRYWLPPVADALSVLWLAAFVALVLGRYRTARRLGVIALAPGVLSLLVNAAMGLPHLDPYRVTFSQVLFALVPVVPLLAMVAFRSDGPHVERSPWLRALVTGILLVLAFELVGVVPLLLQRTAVLAFLFDWLALATIVLVVAAMVASRRSIEDRRAWWLALLVLSGQLIALRLSLTAQYPAPAAYPAVPWVYAAELLMLVGLAGWQVVALRRTAARPQPLPQP
jgi:hypothetical protein